MSGGDHANSKDSGLVDSGEARGMGTLFKIYVYHNILFVVFCILYYYSHAV